MTLQPLMCAVYCITIVLDQKHHGYYALLYYQSCVCVFMCVRMYVCIDFH